MDIQTFSEEEEVNRLLKEGTNQKEEEEVSRTGSVLKTQ